MDSLAKLQSPTASALAPPDGGAPIVDSLAKLQSSTTSVLHPYTYTDASVPHPPDGGASKAVGFVNPEPSLNTPDLTGAVSQAVSTCKPIEQV